VSRYAIGVDLGGTKVEACLIDETRKILARERRPSEPDKGRERVVANILELIAETAGAVRYEAVGMGTPGTYHARDDIMYGSPHTPLYEKPGLVSLLGSKLQVPLIIENDANCLALASSSPSATDAIRRSWPSSWARAWARGSSSEQAPPRPEWERRRDRSHLHRYQWPGLRVRPEGLRRGLSVGAEPRPEIRRALRRNPLPGYDL